ncbi:TnsA-like heteromeric transposase endonuclease subunit [Kitasatospora sp. NPDC092039]|uniref:TnsA-like heteromeric transposase endonuclease subunit n=1 Tax=Kitasatospora sp. NPDC092039 TaxID=3364086 RepID=UPI003819A881
MSVGLRVLPGGTHETSVGGFEVGYSRRVGSEVRLPLADAWAVPFEDAAPAREIRSYKGQHNLPDRWWSSTVERHVGYESWLERDHVLLLDFDPAVVGITSQPFWLFWTTDEGRSLSHAPDYFARQCDGSAVVVDCRPIERRKPRDLVNSRPHATLVRCSAGSTGWSVRLTPSW